MATVLITGASRGLGLEFVLQYATDGWDVIACCRAPAKVDQLKELADKYKIRIEALDVSDLKSIEALAAKLKNEAIDILVNNAGIYSGDPKVEKGAGQNFGAIDAAAWARVLETNVISPIMMTQAFVPHLARGKERKVAILSSKMGSLAEMGTGAIAYRTSKAAVNAAMRTIAPELATHKIAVVNLHPGWVKTDMGGPTAPVEPQDSIAGMRKVIAGLTLEHSGRFIDYQGQIVPW
jgi:NAD(P)-dependent dehydrogenase (short-subunit alcohol dehydrogenase family)